jgi:hypothetical protein
MPVPEFKIVQITQHPEAGHDVVLELAGQGLEHMEINWGGDVDIHPEGHNRRRAHFQPQHAGRYEVHAHVKGPDGERTRTRMVHVSGTLPGPSIRQAGAGDTIESGNVVVLDAGVRDQGYDYEWSATAGTIETDPEHPGTAFWTLANTPPGRHSVALALSFEGHTTEASEGFTVTKASYGPGDTVSVDLENVFRGPIKVDLQPGGITDSTDLPHWEGIKRASEALSFENYKAFMDYLFCGEEMPDALRNGGTATGAKWKTWHDKVDAAHYAAFGAQLPFPDIHSYRVLKAATEAFMKVNCGVAFDPANFPTSRSMAAELRERYGLDESSTLGELWDRYVGGDRLIPYLRAVKASLPDVRFTDRGAGDTVAEAELCDRILRQKVENPCLLELIWSYWHEEGMLVQSMNAISMRFQNRQGPAEIDPLANLAIDALRPLGNLLWGYVQDEQHRLTVARRAYEYDHEYGLTLVGQAVPQVRGADTRSKFLEAFHNLLHRASIFYKEDDDVTMRADAFPVLNALREVHLLLAEGAHNQWGDLPWQARQEMLMQQWILSRPEFREFLPSRVMVPYPEPWMQRIDAMKRVQGWTDTSVRYFRDLGVFGEQIVLSIRWGNWSSVFNRNQAGNWARSWRQEVQWYMHAYQAVTGVDLSSDMQDTRYAEQARERALQPAFHLQRRLGEQRAQTRGQIGGAQAQPRAGSPVPQQRVQS